MAFYEGKNLTFNYVFKLSIPIFMGFFPLGVAFGVLAKSMGVSAFIAVALSTLAYGGAAQYIAYSLPVLLVAAGKLSALRMVRKE